MRDTNGRFLHGHAGYKPKGATAQLTKKTRELIAELIAEEFERIPETLKRLTPEQRLEFVIKLLPYILPKAQEIPEEITSPEEAGIPLIRFIEP